MTMRSRHRVSAWLVPAIALLLVVIALPAMAADGDAQQSYKSIIDAFMKAAEKWQGTLTTMALHVFWLLAGIEFCWVNMMLALRGGDFSDFVSTNTKQILSIGVFLVFINNSFAWSQAVINSFQNAGVQAILASGGNYGPAPVQAFDPGAVLRTGMNIAGVILASAPSAAWNFGSYLIIGLGSIILVLCFVYLAALMALALVESFLIGGGIVLLLGFGGASWTSDIAKRSMMYAFSVGAKLFVINLIIGSAVSVIFDWAKSYLDTGGSGDSTTCFGLIGIVFLVCILAKQVPELVQGMLNGSVIGHGSAMSTFAAAGAAAGALASGGAAAAGAGGAAAAGGGGGAGGVSEGILAAHAHASEPMTPLGMGASALNTGGASTAGSASSSWGGPVSRSNSEMPTAPSREAAERAETPWPSSSSSAGESGGGGMFRGKTAGGHMADAAGHLTDVATGVNPIRGGNGGGGMPQLGKPKSGDDGAAESKPSAGVSHPSASGGEQTPVSGSGGGPSTLDDRISGEGGAGQGGASSPSSSSIDESSVRQAFSSDLEQPHGPAAGGPSSSLSDANSTVSSGLDDPSLRVMQDPASRSLERDLANDSAYEADRTSIDSSNETRLARDSAPKHNPEKNK